MQFDRRGSPTGANRGLHLAEDHRAIPAL